MATNTPSSRFGRGFIVNITHLKVKFSLPPEQAWYGAQDYLTELKLPAQFKGIGVTQLTFIIERSIYVDSTNNIRASNETAIRC